MSPLDGAFSRAKAKRRAEACRNTAEWYRGLLADAQASVMDSTSEYDRASALGCVSVIRRHVEHYVGQADAYERVARGETP